MSAGIGIFLARVHTRRRMAADTSSSASARCSIMPRVWINERYVGEHEGGFLPFSFDVTDFLLEGLNDIKVRVEIPDGRSCRIR